MEKRRLLGRVALLQVEAKFGLVNLSYLAMDWLRMRMLDSCFLSCVLQHPLRVGQTRMQGPCTSESCRSGEFTECELPIAVMTPRTNEMLLAEQMKVNGKVKE